MQIRDIRGSISLQDDFSRVLTQFEAKSLRSVKVVDRALVDLNKRLDELAKSAKHRADAATSAKTLAAIKAENRALQELVNAHKRGLGAVRALNDQREIANRLLQAGVARASVYGQQITKEIQSQQRLRLELEKLHSTRQKLNSTLDKTHAATTRVIKAKDAATHSSKGLGSAIADLTRRMAAYILVGIGLHQITAQVNEMLDAFLSMDRSIRKFRAIFQGDIRLAADEMEFVRQTANRLGIDLQATLDSYSKFAAAMKISGSSAQATRDIFKSVSETAAVMGLTAEDVRLVFLALEQMVSKGRVSMEELRRQLGERIPGAMQMAANAMGITVEALFDMVESGELLTQNLLPGLAKEFTEAFGSQIPAAIESPQAAIGRFKNALFELRVMMGEQVAKAIAEVTAEFVKLSKDKEVVEIFKRLAVAIGDLIKVAGPDLGKLLLGTIKAVTVVVEILANHFHEIKGLIVAIIATKLIIFLDTLPALFYAAARGAAAFAASLGPVGVAIVALTALIVILQSRLTSLTSQWQRDIQSMVNESRKLGDGIAVMMNTIRTGKITPEDLESARNQWASAVNNVKQYKGELKSLEDQAKSLKDKIDTMLPSQERSEIKKQLAPIEENIAAKKRQIDTEEALRRSALATIRHGKEIIGLNKEIAESTKGLVDEYSLAVDKSRELLEIYRSHTGSLQSLEQAIDDVEAKYEAITAAIKDKVAIGSAEFNRIFALIKANKDLERAIDYAKKWRDYTREVASNAVQQNLLTAAAEKSEEALTKAQVTVRLHQALLKSGVPIFDEATGEFTAQAEAVLDQERALIKSENAQRLAENATESLKNQTEQFKDTVKEGTIAYENFITAIKPTIDKSVELINVYKSHTGSLEDLAKSIDDVEAKYEALAYAKEHNIVIGSQEYEDILKLIKGNKDLERALEKGREKAEQLSISIAEIGKKFLENVQDSVADFFKDILNEGNISFDKLGDALKNVLFDVLAEYLAKWIIIQAKMLAAELARIAKAKAAQQAANAAGGATGGATGGGGGWLGALGLGGGQGGGFSASQFASAVGPWIAVAAIIGGIGFSQGWWGKSGKQGVGGVNFGGEGGFGINDTWTAGSSKNLKPVLDKVKAALDQIKDFIEQVDLEVLALGDTVVQKKGQSYTVIAKGITSDIRAALGQINTAGMTAEELSDAIATLAIRTAQFGPSVSKFLEAVIRGSEAITTAQLQAEIEIGRMIESFGQTDFEVAVRNIGHEFNKLFDWLSNQLQDNVTQFTRGATNLVQEEFGRWQARYNELMGIQPSQAELRAQIERQARVFEAEKALRIIDLKVRIETLKAEEILTKRRAQINRAGLIADIKLEQGRRALENAERIGSTRNLGFRKNIWEAELTLQNVINKSMAASVQVMAATVDTGLTLLEAQINALNELIKALESIPPIDFGKLNIPNIGGGGGGTKADKLADQENLTDILDAFDASLLEGVAAALHDINKRFEENKLLAHGNVKLLERLNAMREKELELLRQTLREQVTPFLPTLTGTATVNGQTITTDTGQWRQRAQEIIEWADKIAEENRLLLESTGKAALTAEEIVNATVERMRLLVEEAINSLNLPLEQTRDKFKTLEQTLNFLNTQVDKGIISQQRLAEIIAQVADVELVAFGDALFGFLQKYYGDVEGFEDLRRKLEVVRFNMELANLRLQFQLLKSMGLLTEEVINLVNEVFDYVDKNPIDWDKWLNGGPGGGTGDVGGTTPVRNIQAEIDQAREALQRFLDLALTPYQRDLKALNAEFDKIRAVLGNTTEVVKAYNLALKDLQNRYTQGLQDFLKTFRDTHLPPAQQVAQLQKRFLELAATGDISQSNELLQLAQQLQQAYANTFGSAGGGYQQLLNLIESTIATFLGRASIPIPTPSVNTPPVNVNGVSLPLQGSGTGPLGIIPPPVSSSVSAPGVERRLDTLIATLNNIGVASYRQTERTNESLSVIARETRRKQTLGVSLSMYGNRK